MSKCCLRLEPLEERWLLSVDLVADIRGGPLGSEPQQITDFQGTAFFTADDGTRGRQLWRSDGTGPGTELVVRLPDRTGPLNLTVAGPSLYFSLGGEQLWKTDGTAEGTQVVHDFYGFSQCPRMQDFTALGDSLLFTLWDVMDYGRCPGKLSSSELYASDGTDAGTVQLLRRGVEQPITNLRRVGEQVFFTFGSELWVTDGTVPGTHQVYRFAPGGQAYELTDVNGVLLFTANDGVYGRELWRSDGTPEGTYLVADINPGPAGGIDANQAYPYFTEVNGFLFFTASDGESGFELYASDGTPEGTYLVADINPGPANSAPRNLTNAGGILYFTADDGFFGRELWASYGTWDSTYLVRDLNPKGGAFPASQYENASLAGVAGMLYFVANDGKTGWELWTSDGTEEGTSQVRDIVPGAGSSLDPRQVRPDLTDVGGRLFFAANDGKTGIELWASLAENPGGNGLAPDLVAALRALEEARPSPTRTAFPFPRLDNTRLRP